MRLNIAGKIILFSLVVFCVVIGANTWMNSIYFSKEYSKARQDEVLVIAQTLKSQLDRLLKLHLPVERMVGFEKVCQDVIKEHPFITYAMVVAPDGTILFHNDPSFHRRVISDPQVLQGITSIDQKVQKFISHDELVYDIFIPVTGDKNEHIATIRTGFPHHIVSDKTRKMTLYSAGITIFFLFLGILLLIVVLKIWVTGPIRSFIDSIQDIRENWTDTSRQVEIGSTDEIGKLAEAFNQMTSELYSTTVSKDYLDNILENMLNSLIVIDPDKQILSVNKATLDLLGYQEEDLIGEPFEKVFKSLGKTTEKTFKLKDINGSLSAVEANYISKEGKRIPVLFSSSMMNEKSRQVPGFICLAQDITKLKQAEKEKINARKIAEESRKLALVGQIAGKMAHDFNNILGGIMGVSELAINKCNDENIKTRLKLILNQTIRGRNLTRNLVAFAKSQEPKQNFFSINEKTDLVEELLKKDLGSISFEVIKESGLPDLFADEGMIEHTLVNLLQNSIHAVSKTTKPEIRIRTYSHGENICFDVEDNGCGVPEEYLGQIYDPSFTLKGSNDVTGSYQPGIKGTGYGMSNVKKYVSQHKGSIRISSKVGSGTKVTVCLPVIQKQLSKKEKIEIQTEYIHSNKKILIMEDEPAISDVQYAILSQPPCSHDVDIAQNGSEAVDLFQKNRYDFISLDYIVPGDMNGIDVYNCIRKINQDVPILFASGNIEFLESITDLMEKDPCIGHVSKPCRNVEYISRVNRLLGDGAEKISPVAD